MADSFYKFQAVSNRLGTVQRQINTYTLDYAANSKLLPYRTCLFDINVNKTNNPNIESWLLHQDISIEKTPYGVKTMLVINNGPTYTIFDHDNIPADLSTVTTKLYISETPTDSLVVHFNKILINVPGALHYSRILNLADYPNILDHEKAPNGTPNSQSVISAYYVYYGTDNTSAEQDVYKNIRIGVSRDTQFISAAGDMSFVDKHSHPTIVINPIYFNVASAAVLWEPPKFRPDNHVRIRLYIDRSIGSNILIARHNAVDGIHHMQDYRYNVMPSSFCGSSCQFALTTTSGSLIYDGLAVLNMYNLDSTEVNETNLITALSEGEMELLYYVI